MQNHLSERQQRTKVNSTCNTFFDILYGDPQGSVLGPLLFSICINDITYDIDNCNISSYAVDKTPYTSEINVEEQVVQKFDLITNNLFE